MTENKRASSEIEKAQTKIKRTASEVEKVQTEVIEVLARGYSKFPGMSYEEGVDYTIRWLLGDSDYSPMED